MPILWTAARAERPLLPSAQRTAQLSRLDPPLRVDWLEPQLLADGRPGRLGLTFLPGKRGASLRYPGRVYRRELDRDLGALLEAGVDWLLLLVTDDELARWGDPDIVERAAARGLVVERVPMPDGAAPGSPQLMDAVAERIAAQRAAGNSVAVACMGGVGRTGTVAACLLVRGGMEPDAAIAAVRKVRHPEAVETPAQHRFVATYARHLRAPPARS